MNRRHPAAAAVAILVLWGAAAYWLERDNSRLKARCLEKSRLVARYETLRGAYGTVARKEAVKRFERFLARRGIAWEEQKRQNGRLVRFSAPDRPAAEALSRLFTEHTGVKRVQILHQEGLWRIEAEMGP